MRLSQKINTFVHKPMIRYVRNQYRKKIGVIFKKNPNLNKSHNKEELERHLALWNILLPGCSCEWYKLFSNISELKDYKFVPEDVFYGVIERCLNNCNAAGSSVEDKNDVCFYIPKEYQPKAYLRYVRGVYFDNDFNPITREEAQKILKNLKCSIVGKPSSGSCGGSNVRCFRLNEFKRYVSGKIELSLDWIETNFEAYILQERVLQDGRTAEFNPHSLNTCRMMTFRRPWSGEVSVIATMLRTGCSDEIVDNLASGGISVDVNNTGVLADFAVDKYFTKYFQHPVSKVVFKDFKVPHYDMMAKVVCDIARHVPSYNLLSFDVVAREDGTPCIIEINATSMTLAQLQTCRPLFGDDTEMLVDWCKQHQLKFDRFNHLRTFY